MRLSGVFVLAALAGAGSAGAQERTTISAPTVSVLPIHAVERPDAVAGVVAIVGGGGIRNAAGASDNFLARQAPALGAAGLNVYLLPNADASEEATYVRRRGPDRMRRLHALVEAVRRRARLPVFIVGFSRGSVDAAAYVQEHADAVAGIVLVSGVYQNGSKTARDYAMETTLGRNAPTPVLIVHHMDDACAVSDFAAAQAFFQTLAAPRKAFAAIEGGGATGRACGPFHRHGFEGVEAAATAKIAAWIRANR